MSPLDVLDEPQIDNATSEEISDVTSNQPDIDKLAETVAISYREFALQKFGDWMRDNWEVVDELKSFFPAPGSRATVKVMGDDFTWSTFCDTYLYHSSKHVNDLLKKFKRAAGKMTDEERAEAEKRSKAASQANATTRTSMLQAAEQDHLSNHQDNPVAGCTWCIAGTTGDLKSSGSIQARSVKDNPPPALSESFSIPKTKIDPWDEMDVLRRENVSLKEQVKQLTEKLTNYRAIAAGGAVSISDDDCFHFFKKQANVVNGDAIVAGQVKFITGKFISYLKKMGWQDIDAGDGNFTIINHN